MNHQSVQRDLSLNTRIDSKFLGKLQSLMFKVPPPSWIICQSFAQNRNIFRCILSKENLKSRNKLLTLSRSLSYFASFFHHQKERTIVKYNCERETRRTNKSHNLISTFYFNCKIELIEFEFRS